MGNCNWSITLQNKKGEIIRKRPPRQQNVPGTPFFVYRYTHEDVALGLNEKEVDWIISHKYSGLSVHRKAFEHATKAKEYAKLLWKSIPAEYQEVFNNPALTIEQYQEGVKGFKP